MEKVLRFLTRAEILERPDRSKILARGRDAPPEEGGKLDIGHASVDRAIGEMSAFERMIVLHTGSLRGCLRGRRLGDRDSSRDRRARNRRHCLAPCAVGNSGEDLR
jgi:hypothetical protein